MNIGWLATLVVNFSTAQKLTEKPDAYSSGIVLFEVYVQGMS